MRFCSRCPHVQIANINRLACTFVLKGNLNKSKQRRRTSISEIQGRAKAKCKTHYDQCHSVCDPPFDIKYHHADEISDCLPWYTSSAWPVTTHAPHALAAGSNGLDALEDTEAGHRCAIWRAHGTPQCTNTAPRGMAVFWNNAR